MCNCLENTNCGCNNEITKQCYDNPCKTHLTLSSNVVYNGVILSCINVNPCDTLNVVLQKIDEVICNLIAQNEALQEEITTLTEEIETINEEITIINNTLENCCG